MPRTLLFLLGGSGAFDVTAEEFIPAAGGRDAVIALLMQGGDGWKKYVPEYAEPWMRHGVTRYHPVVPNDSGDLDLETAWAVLREATGIFIGGGHTPTYYRLYATEPVRSLIYERYQAGIPIAGVSAGALIAVEDCVLDADELKEDSCRVVRGLGLVHDLIVGVHFKEWNRLSNLLETMVRIERHVGWGIDESACMVFEGGQFKRILGQSVHKVVMADFATGSYAVTEWAMP